MDIQLKALVNGRVLAALIMHVHNDYMSFSQCRNSNIFMETVIAKRQKNQANLLEISNAGVVWGSADSID